MTARDLSHDDGRTVKTVDVGARRHVRATDAAAQCRSEMVCVLAFQRLRRRVSASSPLMAAADDASTRVSTQQNTTRALACPRRQCHLATLRALFRFQRSFAAGGFRARDCYRSPKPKAAPLMQVSDVMKAVVAVPFSLGME